MIKLWIIDVDGTMTDGGIYYDEHGNELKKFCTIDAAGFFAAQESGARILVVTGRECAATKRRMSELKIDYLFQNIKDKYSFLKNFISENHISKEVIGYIGDDLNDYQSMSLAGYIGCPSNSCSEIREISHYVSPIPGGKGAVRDIIEHYLKECGLWEHCVKKVFMIGI